MKSHSDHKQCPCPLLAHVSDKTCDTWNPETGSWAEKDVSLIGCKAENSWTPARGEGTYLIGGYGGGSGAGGDGNGAEGWEDTETRRERKQVIISVPNSN